MMQFAYRRLMNKLKQTMALALVAAFAATPFVGLAAEAKKPKPYTLKTCAVSGEELGSMGDPYVFQHRGREIKLCCKGCLKTFNKQPEKFIKSVEKAEAEAAKKSKKTTS
jgi:hypothetical protein